MEVRSQQGADQPIAEFRYAPRQQYTAVTYFLILGGIGTIFLFAAISWGDDKGFSFLGVFVILMVTLGLALFFFNLCHMWASRIIFFRDRVVETAAFLGDITIHLNRADVIQTVQNTRYSSADVFVIEDETAKLTAFSRIRSHLYRGVKIYLSFFSEEEKARFYRVLTRLSGRSEHELKCGTRIPFKSERGEHLIVNWDEQDRREWRLFAVVCAVGLLIIYLIDASWEALLGICIAMAGSAFIGYIDQQKRRERFEKVQRGQRCNHN